MATTSKDQILEKVVELLEPEPHGIRYSDLVRRTHEALPHIPKNTIHGTVWNLEIKTPDHVALRMYARCRGFIGDPLVFFGIHVPEKNKQPLP
ncbi:MAG TPA: hypothetical protein VN494_08040 [Patescibacteria group bacterium]|nr:hypothetical protein [Patescibacteria group bacterium]